MKTFIVLSCLVACAFAIPDLSKWNEWKKLHGRNYLGEEELSRQKIFFQNLKKIELHNKQADAGIHTYRLAVNKFADLTTSEFAAKMNRMKHNPFLSKSRNYVRLNNVRDVPTSIDWRTKGVVGPIKDQGQCGSCWAFSAIASTEAAHALVTGNLTLLSEQNLVDCSGDYGNDGCDGGLMDQAFDYIIANKGIDTESSYPYEAVDDTCRFKAKNVGSTVSSYVDIPSGDEQALMNATATVGPISVAIDASSFSFQFYTSGVYVDNECSTDYLDHGVAVVGYDSLNGQAYWTVRNSWGEDWGFNGYILMARNRDNMCGIATAASYPIVTKN